MDLHHHINSLRKLYINHMTAPLPTLSKQDVSDPFPHILWTTDECFVHVFNLRPTGHILAGLSQCAVTFVCTMGLNQCVVVQGNAPVRKPHEHRIKPNLQKPKSWVPTWTRVEYFPLVCLTNLSERWIWRCTSHCFFCSKITAKTCDMLLSVEALRKLAKFHITMGVTHLTLCKQSAQIVSLPSAEDKSFDWSPLQ